ncbi:MAG: hemolysin III family protein [Angelakisella sp.]
MAPKFYTRGEEIANSVSHGVGAWLFTAATAVMLVFAALTGDPVKIAASAVYGGTLILLYVMSTLYHSFTGEKVKAVFRIFDHCTIFLLIAGTYTPFTLISLRGPLGWTLFAVVWGAAVLGIVLNAISLERFKVFSIICYIAMGWAIVFAAKPLSQALTPTGMWLILAGGFCYMGGLVFYGIRRRFTHSVWHMFVLAGSILHYICILSFCILK